MKFVHILVEGQTEELFVREILNEYLAPKAIYLNTIVAVTKQAIGSKTAFRGGVVSYGKIKNALVDYVHDTNAIAVTTMIDYYHLPDDFPGFKDKETQEPDYYKAVAYLEKQFAADIHDAKFIPYLAIHEFEGLLFSEPEKIVTEVRGSDEKLTKVLTDIRNNYDSPEQINKVNPPSKRILSVLTEYQKVAHGFLIAVEIGIEAMLKECPHFREWLAKIESLADERS